jgi:hypothetical protein
MGTGDANAGAASLARPCGGRSIASWSLAGGEGKLLSMPLLWLGWDGVGGGIAASSRTMRDVQSRMCVQLAIEVMLQELVAAT